MNKNQIKTKINSIIRKTIEEQLKGLEDMIDQDPMVDKWETISDIQDFLSYMKDEIEESVTEMLEKNLK